MSCPASSASMASPLLISELMVVCSFLYEFSVIFPLYHLSAGTGSLISQSSFPDSWSINGESVISYRVARRINEMTSIWCLARCLAHSKQFHLTCTFSKPQFPRLIIPIHWVVVRIRNFINSRKVCVCITKAIGVVFRNTGWSWTLGVSSSRACFLIFLKRHFWMFNHYICINKATFERIKCRK